MIGVHHRLSRRATAGRLGAVLVLVLVSACAGACQAMKSPVITPPTKASMTIYETLAAIQDAEMIAKQIGVVKPGDHKEINRWLVVAWTGEQMLNDALDATSRKAAANTILDGLEKLAPAVMVGIADLGKRDAIMQLVTTGITIVRGVLASLREPALVGGVQ